MNNILVIEDDKIMRENISELLELSGYNVKTAINGKEGLDKIKEYNPNLVICDIMMPEIDGFSVLHLLKKDEHTSNIPFIFLTAKSEHSSIRQGMNMGADDFLVKPFQDIDLLNSVESRLKNRVENKSKIETEISSSQSTEEMLDNLLKDLSIKKYSSKEFVYRESDKPHYLFYIISGQIKTYKLNQDGKELITGVYEQGEHFGYKPLLENRRYSEFAEPISDVELYKIPRERFLKLIKKSNKAANIFMKIISKDLTNKEDDMISIAYSSVRKRVADKILELTEDSNTISITRTNMAGMVGTSVETFVRVVTELKKMKVLETSQTEIELLDRNKLSKLKQQW